MNEKKMMKQREKSFDVTNCSMLTTLSPPPKQRTSSIGQVDLSLEPSKLPPPPLKEFDDLKSFEMFLHDETEDNEFDYCHAHVAYYPPFVLKLCHNDVEKIKPTMNFRSKKYKRDLMHHVQNHLLAELERCCGYKLEMGKPEVSGDEDHLIWNFKDDSDHGFDPEQEKMYNRHWRTDLKVSCNGSSPMVEVDYMAVPV